MARLLSLLLLLQTIVPVASFCSVYYYGTCSGTDRSTTTTITLLGGSDDASEYEADVIFHWGPDDTSLGTQTYPSGEEDDVVETHEYGEEGQSFLKGYTVTFGEGSGCEGDMYEGYYEVTFDDATKSCTHVKAPAGATPEKPSEPPPSPAPVAPSVDTPAPVTSAPVTPAPVLPAKVPSPAPVEPDDTVAPTEAAVAEKPSEPAPSPTPPSATPAPVAPSVDTPVPVLPLPPVAPPTVAPPDEQTEPVSSMMTLFHSELMDTDAEIVWRSVTETNILTEAVAMTGIPSKIVYVKLIEQNVLQESRGPVLEIEFTTTIEMPSNKKGVDEHAMVAAGFDTPEKQQRYIDTLKEVDDSYFQDVEEMDMGIYENGKLIPVESYYQGDDDPDGGDGGSSTQWGIIGGVIAGVCVIAVGMGIGVYRAKRRKSLQDVGGGEDSSTSQQKEDKLGMEIDTKPETISNEPCLGVIEPKPGYGDEISTLGEPYMGDAADALFNADRTVGESLLSSQQGLYVYGVKKPFGGDASRAGGSTINTPRTLVFGDDATLEEIFEQVEDDPNFERIEIVAPAGMLGIVLDNPHGDLPVVYAIKETSALRGQMRVGDLLISVDEVDCRGLSAHNVSTLLSNRSQNARTLVVARGTGFDEASACDV